MNKFWVKRYYFILHELLLLLGLFIYLFLFWFFAEGRVLQPYFFSSSKKENPEYKLLSIQIVLHTNFPLQFIDKITK